MTSAVRLLARWYLAPTGLLFVVGVVAGLIIAATVHEGIGLSLVGVAAAIVLPYKLTRLEQARLRAGRAAAGLASHVARVDSRVGAVDRRIESVDRRTQQVRRDLLGSVATTREELTMLLRSERLIWTDALANSTSGVSDAVAANTERLDQAEGRAAARLDEVESRLAELDRLTDALTGRLQNDRRQRYLAAARRDAALRPVEGVLLLICAQRVGSTWLVDLLRNHPAILFHPTADIYRRLGMSGRRYPAHLSDACHDGLEVEVQAGVGGLVPSFATRTATAIDDRGTYAIEKIHPSAMGFDYDHLVQGIDAFRTALGADRVVPLYLVRDPVESMQSFVSYRRRDPAWHADVPEAHVHDFYRRSYDVIESIYRHLPGVVVAYDDLRADPTTVVADLLIALELEKTELDARRSAEVAVAAASPDRSTPNPFFSSGSDMPEAAEIELGVGAENPGRAQLSLERCREVVRGLRSTRNEPPRSALPT